MASSSFPKDLGSKTLEYKENMFNQMKLQLMEQKQN